jgi:hypothetical protein
LLNNSDDFPIHIMLRFSDAFLREGNTIPLHQSVLKERGAVWYGKTGKPLARRHVTRINAQCEAGVPTFLYLVQRVGGNYELHKGVVEAMSRDYPKLESSLVPEYYAQQEFLRGIRLWTKLRKLSRAPGEELPKLVLLNTGMPARLSLLHSMAGLFIVRRYNSR